MANEKAIREHVGQVEFLKEQARMVAEAIAGNLDPAAILADPDAFARDVLEVLRYAVRDQVAAAGPAAWAYAQELGLRAADEAELDLVAEQAEADFLVWFFPILLASLAPIRANLQERPAGDVISPAVRDRLMVPLAATLKRGAAGIVADVHRATMNWAAESTAIVSDLLGPGQAIVEGARDVARAMGDVRRGDPNTLEMTWITMEDSAVCEGELDHACEPRHGMTLSWAEWQDLGVPADPRLICEAVYGANCRCVLEIAGRPITGGPIRLADTIRDAKARARQEADAEL